MNPVNDEDLNAYVDGALDPERRLEVEAWLAGHAEDAQKVAAWQEQNRALHAAFDSVLNEPLPLELVRASRRRGHLTIRWRAVAAAFALTAVGLSGFYIGRQSVEPVLIAALPRDAALAHVVFSPEQRHPVEVDAAHAEHLTTWLSKRLGAKLAAPDFAAQGFELLGGRLLAGGAGPVAQFMYQDAQQRRVTLYVRRNVDQHNAGQRDTAFRHAVEGGVEVFYWIDRDMGYALSGDIEHDAMRRLADAAYRQIDR
jgi:anti-sigma factor RsiW